MFRACRCLQLKKIIRPSAIYLIVNTSLSLSLSLSSLSLSHLQLKKIIIINLPGAFELLRLFKGHNEHLYFSTYTHINTSGHP